MYDDPYLPKQGGLAGFLRAISATFRVGRFFGVELRIFWLTIILVPVLLLFSYLKWTSGFVEAFTYMTITTVLLYVIIYAHEMSHVFAGRRFRMRTPLIRLSPIGGTAHMATPAPNPRAELMVALAGPASHLPWLLVFAPLWFFVFEGSYEAFDLFRPDGWGVGPAWFTVQMLFWTNLWLMIFNLLPFFPMDGGRSLRALLARKMHPNRATMIATQIGIVGAVLFMVGGLFLPGWGGGILIAIGISNLMACLQERKVARYTGGPYDATAQVDPWQSDPDGWRHAGGGDDPDSGPGFFARRRQKKAQERAQREREGAAALEAEVDRILAKVSEVGMVGLTEAEKKTLMKASKSGKRK